MKKRARIVRSYVLALRPNPGKAEAARYAIWWQARLCLDYVQRLHSLPSETKVSTAGRGKLDDYARQRARAIIRAGRAAQRATGRRFEKPESVAVCADARIQHSRRPGAQFWVKVPRGPFVPAQTHRGLNRALRRGGRLRSVCELRHGRCGGFVVRVFVEHPKPEVAPSGDVLGADVGINHGVTTSDGRTGRSLHPILEQHRARNAERRRQGHRTAGARTQLKQLLDREARRIVASAQRAGRTIAIERLKTLGNLKPSGSIGGWARRHCGERVRQIAEVSGVAVVEVHPAYTSQCCPRCDYVDRDNRRGIAFNCTACGYVAHADVVGARNIARKARGAWFQPGAKAARQTRAQSGERLAS